MMPVLPKVLRSKKNRNLLFLFLVISMSGAAYGFKKNYDPGPVSAAHPRGAMLNGYESHASFEKECTHCHAPVRCLSPNLCQDCHLDIARQRAEATGLHGLLPGTDKCQNCHMEHQGRDAIISAVPFVNINHDRLTGFSLVHHQSDADGTPLTCHDCHAGGRFEAESVDCTTCHNGHDPAYMGEHTTRFGGNCLGCHDGQDRMVNLDHELVFVLDGGHAGQDCEACHSDQTFADTTRDCADCHPEPEVHAGSFGQDCARCHATSAWAPAQLQQHAFFLNHGSDEQLECQACHVETYTAITCYGCHDHEPNEMRALHLAEGIAEAEVEDCARCHPTGQPGEADQIAAQEPGVPAGSESQLLGWETGGSGDN